MLTKTEAADLARIVRSDGDCVGSPNPDAWHPDEPRKGGAESQEAYEARKATYEYVAADLCASCPVKAECLELALDEEATLPRSWVHGVRGGLAPWQRHQMGLHRRLIARQEVA